MMLSGVLAERFGGGRAVSALSVSGFAIVA
jgi:hypothetical protein